MQVFCGMSPLFVYVILNEATRGEESSLRIHDVGWEELVKE